MFRRGFAFIAGIEGGGGFDIAMAKHQADDFVLAGVRLQEISRREVTRQMRVELSTGFARDDGGQGSTERTGLRCLSLTPNRYGFPGPSDGPETAAVVSMIRWVSGGMGRWRALSFFISSPGMAMWVKRPCAGPAVASAGRAATRPGCATQRADQENLDRGGVHRHTGSHFGSCLCLRRTRCAHCGLGTLHEFAGRCNSMAWTLGDFSPSSRRMFLSVIPLGAFGVTRRPQSCSWATWLAGRRQ